MKNNMTSPKRRNQPEEKQGRPLTRITVLYSSQHQRHEPAIYFTAWKDSRVHSQAEIRIFKILRIITRFLIVNKILAVVIQFLNSICNKILPSPPSEQKNVISMREFGLACSISLPESSVISEWFLRRLLPELSLSDR